MVLCCRGLCAGGWFQSCRRPRYMQLLAILLRERKIAQKCSAQRFFLCGRGPSPKPEASFLGPFRSWLIGKPRDASYLDVSREKNNYSPRHPKMCAMAWFSGFWALALEINPNKTGFAVFLLAKTYMDLPKRMRGRGLDLAH